MFLEFEGTIQIIAIDLKILMKALSLVAMYTSMVSNLKYFQMFELVQDKSHYLANPIRTL